MDQNIIFIGSLFYLREFRIYFKIRERIMLHRFKKRTTKNDIISKAKSEGENIKKDKIFKQKSVLELKSSMKK